MKKSDKKAICSAIPSMGAGLIVLAWSIFVTIYVADIAGKNFFQMAAYMFCAATIVGARGTGIFITWLSLLEIADILKQYKVIVVIPKDNRNKSE